MMGLRRAALFPLFLLAAVSACGTGAVGSKVRPPDPTAASVLGEAACRPDAERAEPLVVDWTAEQRSDLELAMQQGVAVVAYGCGGVQVLRDCRVEGAYGFASVTPKSEVIELDDADEIRANIPGLAPLLQKDLGAELSRGSAVRLATILVGRRRSPVAKAAKLVGECDGASHFVRGAFVGAFAMGTATRGQLGVSFGDLVKAASSSSRRTSRTDGDATECGTAAPGQAAPPIRCGTAVRLELVSVKRAVVVMEKEDVPTAVSAACPAGMVFGAGKCTQATDEAPHLCEVGDLADCTKQCERGNAGSCTNAGFAHHEGKGAALDAGKAVAFFERACAGGDGPGCFDLGVALDEGDPKRAADGYRRGCDLGEAAACNNLGRAFSKGFGLPRDDVKARALYDLACKGGSLLGCNNLGTFLLKGRGGKEDKAAAIKLTQAACEGGHLTACSNLASYLELGDGLPKDLARAIAIYKETCEAGDDLGCSNLGAAYGRGLGVPLDAKKAAELYGRACDRGFAQACQNLGGMHIRGELGPPNPARAYLLFQKGCTTSYPKGCFSVGLNHYNGEGTPKDPAKAEQAWLRACAADDGTSCSMLGVLLGERGDLAGAAKQFEAGCALADGAGCLNLGIFQEEGKGVPKNLPAAKASFQKACKYGNEKGCKWAKDIK